MSKYSFNQISLKQYIFIYYKNWKKVEDNWAKTLSEATVNVSPKVYIKSIGVSE